MKKKEIELKFVIDSKYLKQIANRASEVLTIIQGYFDITNNFRIRTVNNGGVMKSYLTIKGDRDNLTREEYEYEIPYEEGLELIKNFTYYTVLKTRYLVKNGKDNWEIDVFHGENSGLIIAELEICREDYDIKMPKWVDEWKPVHDDERYYNSYLSKHPYSEWENKNGKERD